MKDGLIHMRRKEHMNFALLHDEEKATGKPERKVYTVTEITRLIKSEIENGFGSVWVQGELSNVRRPSSGHCYFTIKDKGAQIKAVMFRGDQRHLIFEIKDGLLALAFGELTVYEAGGYHQVIVRRLEESGKGSLYAAFEALKKKLSEEGLFDPTRKKPLPLLPQHIGIVTSPTGAAIRDILNILLRRFPNIHILLAPVRVQGEGAAEEIAAAIDLLNERGGLDVLIVGRGGGSFEDLWCFNGEVVARAIARSRLPVISAVGHETDYTISDFVADLRAPTPSAAAELVVGLKESFEQKLETVSLRLARALRERFLRMKNRCLAASRSYVFAEPANVVRRHRQRMTEMLLRIKHGVHDRLRESQQRIDELRLRTFHQVDGKVRVYSQRIGGLSSQLRALNPLAVLDRGYSVTRDERGRLVVSVEKLIIGQRVTTRVSRGSFESEVVKRHEREE